MKTPITYYGGKQSMIHHILPLIPPHEVYTEPFCGGGTVFFAKEPAKNETINDKLDIVITFYQQLKTNFDELKALIDSTLYSRSQFNQAKKILKMNGQAEPLQKAWAFFALNHMAYASKVESSAGMKYSNDQYSVQPAQFTNKKAELTRKFSRRLENVHIENNDAIWILNSRNVKKAFHYLDPPYPGADQGHYKGYDFPEYEKLLKWCQDECKGKFMLSNYPSDLLQQYIDRNGWFVRTIIQKNKVNRHKTNTELLIMNYDPATIHGQLKLEL